MTQQPVCGHPLKGGARLCEFKASLSLGATTPADELYQIRCCKKHAYYKCNTLFQNGHLLEYIFEEKKPNKFDFFPYRQIKGLEQLVQLRNHPNAVQVPPPAPPPPAPLPHLPIPAPQPAPQPPPPPALVPPREYPAVLDTTQKHPCCICYEDTDDVFCTSNRHVMCKDCFDNHVLAECDRTEFDGKVECPLKRMNDCDCNGFSINHIAKHVKDETFVQFDRKRYEYKEKRAIDKVKEEISRTSHLSQDEKDKKFIIEEILTLKCNTCNLAYLDFDGCCAVKCRGCQTYFCAKCHATQPSNQASHTHVGNCRKYGATYGIWCSSAQLKETQAKRRTERLTSFLNSLANNNRSKNLVKSLKKELKDLNVHIVIPNIVG